MSYSGGEGATVCRGLVCVVALLVGVFEADAQVHPFEPEDGFAESPAAVEDVFAQCGTELPIRHRGEVLDLGCSVVNSTSLGSVSARRAWMVQYRRTGVLASELRHDTLDIDELVLVQESNDVGFQVVWRLAKDRLYEFLGQVRSAPNEDAVLVGYNVCLNGTGGCFEHFLLGAAAWTTVSQVFLEDLAEFVPDGWSIHKGRSLDLESLEGTQPIARPGDANCCPSGMMSFSVQLVGRELRLTHAEVLRGS